MLMTVGTVLAASPAWGQDAATTDAVRTTKKPPKGSDTMTPPPRGATRPSAADTR